MKLRIVYRVLFLLFIALSSVNTNAQKIVSNPLEYGALIEGNDLINSQISSQTQKQLKTAGVQATMMLEFAQIKNWDDKYNQYLKSVQGFASALKACTTLYHDGVHIFLTLGNIKKAVSENPQGLVSTSAMNNLYLETAIELVSVFVLLNDAVAKGGEENMLTGADRAEIMWALENRLSAFNVKLRQLYLSIRYYTISDVWNSYSSGVWRNDNAHVAQMALSRWRRAAKVATR